MPIPKPHAGESHDDFHSRCMGNETMMSDYPDQAQRNAVCYSAWDEVHGSHPKPKAAPPAVTRAWSTLEIKSLDAEQRTIEGMASTPTVDRIGDVVDPMGASFKVPLPLLWQHKHSEPVGHVTFANATPEGIGIRAKIARIDEPGELKNLCDKAWQAVKAGLVRGLSIGFSPTEFDLLPDGTGFKFSKYSLLELSLVTIPANAEATITVVRSADLAASGRSDLRPGASGKTSVNLKPSKGKPMATIAEQLTALEAKRAANSGRMTEIMNKAATEGRSTDDQERDEFDTLAREVDTIDGDLARLRTLEKANLAKATPVSGVTTVDNGSAVRGGSLRVIGPRLEPGIRFARVAKAIGMARGNLGDAQRIAEGLWGDDQPIVNILKAAVQAGTTISDHWAGALVGDESTVFADFVEYLRPQTIIGKFGTNGIPNLRRVPFRVALIGQTTGGTGYWVGEAAAKPLTSFDFTRTTLTPLKVATICVVSEEVLRDSSPSAEGILRDSLAGALTERLDIDFIATTKGAVANVSPASITNGVSPTASSGNDEAGVREDVLTLMRSFLTANNPPTSGVWIMSAATAMALQMMVNPLGQQSFPGLNMNGGSFFGMPVIVSEHVQVSGSPTARIVILVNASDIYLGDEGGISIDMSREASLVMDSAPTMAAAALTSPQTPVAAQTVSLWQTNTVGFRAERTINWKARRTGVVKFLSGVAWGT